MEHGNHCIRLQSLFYVVRLIFVFGVSLSLADQCDISQNEKLQCGNSDVTRADCEAKSCCFEEQQCYYGNTVTVQCTRDGEFVVVVARDVTIPQLALSSVSLLGGSDSPCSPVSTTPAFAIFQFPVTACGTRLKAEEGYVVYENVMSSTYDMVPGPSGSITRDSAYKLLFQCWYLGSDIVPLVAEVGTVAPPLPVMAPGPLCVELRLARDSEYDSYYGEMDYPVTKILRQPVFVEVRVLERTDPNIALSLGDCWATSTPSPDSALQWTLLVNGCPYKDDNLMTTLVPVDGSSGLPYQTHYKRFIVHMLAFVDAGHLIHLKERVFIHCSAAVCRYSALKSIEERCNRQRRHVSEAQKAPSMQTVVVSSREVTLTGTEFSTSNQTQNSSNNEGKGDTIVQDSMEKAEVSISKMKLTDPNLTVPDFRESHSAELDAPCRGGRAEKDQFSSAYSAT
ncbi:hypothetical protein COCON_G00044750 [Conger conger]|uniref:Zona pellucida sperm-binding protein 4 n=1 Tax=Conger conger TaxID=82655 RepID=A0A9Q1I4X9_CONCO|nr:hypothetical protein COCON_G00044750 [Conger conger]